MPCKTLCGPTNRSCSCSFDLVVFLYKIPFCQDEKYWVLCFADFTFHCSVRVSCFAWQLVFSLAICCVFSVVCVFTNVKFAVWQHPWDETTFGKREAFQSEFIQSARIIVAKICSSVSIFAWTWALQTMRCGTLFWFRQRVRSLNWLSVSFSKMKIGSGQSQCQVCMRKFFRSHPRGCVFRSSQEVLLTEQVFLLEKTFVQLLSYFRDWGTYLGRFLILGKFWSSSGFD